MGQALHEDGIAWDPAQHFSLPDRLHLPGRAIAQAEVQSIAGMSDQRHATAGRWAGIGLGAFAGTKAEQNRRRKGPGGKGNKPVIFAWVPTWFWPWARLCASSG